MSSRTIFINSKKFKDLRAELPLAIGYSDNHRMRVIDLANAPNILVAGVINKGVPSCLDAIVSSLLSCRHSDELILRFIDPKGRAFRPYLDRTHDETIFSTDVATAEKQLTGLCSEMEQRLESSITRPHIICFINEYSWLTFSVHKSKRTPERRIADAIGRLAHEGHASGIHLVLATERPLSDVITRPIKANFTTRIATKVSCREDSRLILDIPGAERLSDGEIYLKQGDSIERLKIVDK